MLRTLVWSGLLSAVGAALPAVGSARADDPPTSADVRAALRKALGFFDARVAVGGGYVWAYSGDLTLREGEGRAGRTKIWVQPPGTPTVGEAFVDAYEATGNAAYLQSARDTAHCLVRGQLHSGGWFYHIDVDAAGGGRWLYRYGSRGRLARDPTSAADRASTGGWDVWKRRKYKGNLTILDDDTTQAAVRFLLRVDRALGFKDAKVHEVARYALRSLRGAQYPNGAWSANYDRFPGKSPSAERYPVTKASYPDSWPRTWPKDFRGCYVINDNVIADMIATMLAAWRTYGDGAYLSSAERAGGFLLLAQMPEPQPAWAQQYDRRMHPVWDRPFEPPAVSGRESQDVLEALMRLYRATGKRKYLEPIPRAIAYLRKSRLAEGELARFYELKTNRPLYFYRGRDRRHRLTYSRDRLPTHYAFVVASRLDAIEAAYGRLAKGAGGPATRPAGHRRDGRAAEAPKLTPALAAKVRAILDGLDERGAWVERGRLRAHKVEPESGVIRSQTFVSNVRTLCLYLKATKRPTR